MRQTPGVHATRRAHPGPAVRVHIGWTWFVVCFAQAVLSSRTEDALAVVEHRPRLARHALPAAPRITIHAHALRLGHGAGGRPRVCAARETVAGGRRVGVARTELQLAGDQAVALGNDAALCSDRDGVGWAARARFAETHTFRSPGVAAVVLAALHTHPVYRVRPCRTLSRRVAPVAPETRRTLCAHQIPVAGARPHPQQSHLAHRVALDALLLSPRRPRPGPALPLAPVHAPEPGLARPARRAVGGVQSVFAGGAQEEEAG